ncbi:MAG: hypothetical protein QXK66_00070 [Sulfolobales archaeon]
MELLSLAYMLSLLTYSLGAVLYGSPLPLKSIKKWGVLMMYDGLASAVLVSAYSLLLKLGDYFLAVLGASWPNFITWLTGRTTTLVASYLAIQSIAAALKVSGADILVELLKHISSLIATSLTAIKTIYLISTVVYSLRDKILAIGILLYTIPLRMGKSAGAAIVALSIVYYIGMPLMPVFALALESPQPPIASDRYGAITGSIVDFLGNPVPHAVVKFYKSSRDPAIVVLGDSEGKFYVGPPQDLLSLGDEFEVEVAFMGYAFGVDPALVRVPWSGSLRVSNMLYAGKGLSIVFIGILEISSVNLSSGLVVLDLKVLGSEATLVFLKLKPVEVEKILIGVEPISCSWSAFSWEGLEVEECFITLSEGKYMVKVSYFGSYVPRPKVEEKHYVDIGDIVGYLNVIQTTAVSYLYSYLLLPSAYLIILSASSYALSKFLGGGLRLRVV